MADDPETVDIELEDGTIVTAPRAIAHLVRGVDADDDLVVPLGTPDQPIYDEDGAEALIALTPCHAATGKGSDVSTGVVCRRCYEEVHWKYGSHATVAVATASHR